jgi:hypothetical protein
MFTNRPILPADGAALGSVSVSASVPLTATIERVPSSGHALICRSRRCTCSRSSSLAEVKSRFGQWATPDRSFIGPPIRRRILLISALGPYPPGRQSYQPTTVGPAFVGVIRIKQRRCLIMAVR